MTRKVSKNGSNVKNVIQISLRIIHWIDIWELFIKTLNPKDVSKPESIQIKRFFIQTSKKKNPATIQKENVKKKETIFLCEMQEKLYIDGSTLKPQKEKLCNIS